MVLFNQLSDLRSHGVAFKAHLEKHKYKHSPQSAHVACHKELSQSPVRA